jgi:hypothetical protein
MACSGTALAFYIKHNQKDKIWNGLLVMFDVEPTVSMIIELPELM